MVMLEEGWLYTTRNLFPDHCPRQRFYEDLMKWCLVLRKELSEWPRVSLLIGLI